MPIVTCKSCSCKFNSGANDCPQCGHIEPRVFTKKNKIRLFFLIVAMLSTAAIVAFVLTRPGPEQVALENTKKLIQKAMRDPDSLRIIDSYNINMIRDTDWWQDRFGFVYICGSFNGKNAFGGFGDSTLFVSTNIQIDGELHTSVRFEEESNDKVEELARAGKNTLFINEYWNNLCVDETHKAITKN